MEININNDYEIDYQNYIGKGSFGVVYKGKDKKTGELVAIKKIEYDHSNSIEIENEINNMKLLNSCKYSISIIKTYKDDRFYYIIMELCDKSLNKLIEGKNNLDLKTIKLILKQLNVVFKKMRELNMIHRDIKPLNILLKKENNKLTVRLTDYGLTKILSTSNKASTIARIPFYIAPEIKLEEFSDIKFSDKSKVDLWSIGIMIHELYFKKFPFKSQLDYINYLQHNGNSQYININKSPDNDFNNLIENLLVFDYRNRIS
jgi:serine/threonine-protein kinase ULK/ATG1